MARGYPEAGGNYFFHKEKDFARREIYTERSGASSSSFLNHTKNKEFRTPLSFSHFPYQAVLFPFRFPFGGFHALRILFIWHGMN